MFKRLLFTTSFLVFPSLLHAMDFDNSNLDQADLTQKEDAYYSSKHEAFIFNAIGTGLVLGGLAVFSNTATCTDNTNGTIGQTCTTSDPTGAYFILAATPFFVIGTIEMVNAFIKGHKLKKAQHNYSLNLAPTFNPKTNQPGLALIGSF